MKNYLLLLMGLFLYSSAYSQKLVFKWFDLKPNGDALAGDFTNFNGQLLFNANSAANSNTETWIGDGTPAGTHKLKPSWPTSFQCDMTSYAMLKGRLFCRVFDELWVTDGTDTGTKQLVPPNVCYEPQFFIECNGKIIFSASDYVNGWGLWVTDGTAAGTKRISDKAVYSVSWDPLLISYNGKVYYAGQTMSDNYGVELYCTDGTTAGTKMVKDISPGSDMSSPASGRIYNGKLYFTAETVAEGRELWVTDGTAAGTHLIKDIYPGPVRGACEMGVVLNGKLLFAANDTNTGSLWATDGTTAGTQMLKDLLPGHKYAEVPVNLYTILNNRLYFSIANSGAVWSTDGTDTGTRFVTNKAVAVNSFGAYKNHIYFRGLKAVADAQMWVTDGTDAGTHIIAPAGGAPDPANNTSQMFEYNGSLYFNAHYNIAGDEAWYITDTAYYPPATGISNAVSPDDKIVVYPNPSHGNFTIETGTASFDGMANIYDVTGRLIQSDVIKGVKADIQLQAPAGIYFLKLTGSPGIYRLIIE